MNPPATTAYHDVVARWIRGHLDASGRRPLVVGVNGPQGSGKSTLADAVVQRIGAADVRAIAISVDDFYLRADEQRALAAAHSGNRCLEYRGYPGTHDVALGTATLDALRAGRPVTIPAYDKSAHGGRGDRAPEAAFRHVDDATDLVVFEGWMLGFTPVATDTLADELRPPNAMLAAYAPWNAAIDVFVHLVAASPDDIVRWRVDAERARRAAGAPGLTDGEARDYIERFLPAYRAWVPGLRTAPPGRDALVVGLGPDRSGTVARNT